MYTIETVSGDEDEEDLGLFSDEEKAVTAANDYLSEEGVDSPHADQEEVFHVSEGLEQCYTVNIEEV